MSEFELPAVLLQQAKKHLGEIANIRAAVNSIESDPDWQVDLRNRLREFDQVLKQMRFLAPLDKNVYTNLTKFRLGLLRNYDYPPSLSETLGILQDSSSRDAVSAIYRDVLASFRAVRQNIVSNRWPFVTEITDRPIELASGLLIEGYGIFAEQFSGASNLQRPFVLGFEEVLLMQYPQFGMTGDAIGWMREDINKFSLTVAQQIRAYPAS